MDKVKHNNESIVWILGAGFSKPLGGPLLPQLLSKELRNQHEYHFPKNEYTELYTPEADAVLELYWNGLGLGENRKYIGKTKVPGYLPQLWSNAECFLDWLSSDDPFMLQLYHWFLPTGKRDLFISDAIKIARKLIAADCSVFLKRTNMDLEKWGPYKLWAQNLVDAGDTVITFNYDTVIEHLKTSIVENKLTILSPDSLMELCFRDSTCLVMKMHGSTNWSQDETGGISVYKRSESDKYFHAIKTGLSPAIGIPGPLKKTITERLNNIWKEALKALKNARAIVVVGYSFPQTDSLARNKLFEAIRDNQNKNLSVHIVVGQDRQTRDRLTDLFSRALQSAGRVPLVPSRKVHRKTYQLIVTNLYGEDFFTVSERRQIINPMFP